MRVTGGTLGGRRLRVPPGGVRPTADRVREALFARLGDLGGVRVLDLFAGSGALGIEALSRGAQEAVFVERAGAVAAVLRANLEALGLAGRTRLLRADVRTAIRRLAREDGRFGLVLLDPPYGLPALPEVLRELAISGIVSPGAEIVLETASRLPVPEIPELALLDERRYGDTRIVRLAVARDEGAPEGRDTTEGSADA